ncbi:MAG: hypothetical protein WCA20_07500 [Candidatus Sulfotelmatobacter sp.]
MDLRAIVGTTSYAIFGARNYGERSPMQRIPAILSAWSATGNDGVEALRPKNGNVFGPPETT